jgi:CMP-N-acetylneuraminic acid synthetase
MKIAAIITGKGSSSLKNKNMLKINNRPVLFYPCVEAKKVKEINKFYASSEDKKILGLCYKYGYKKILRPKFLAMANTRHSQVLKHALNFMTKDKFKPEIIVVLLANAPIIKAKWIIDCIKIIINNKKVTAAVPVVLNNDHNPYRAKKIKNGYLRNFVKTKKKISSNRQQLNKSFFLCHNFWVIRTSAIIREKGEGPWNFMGKFVRPYLVKNSIDIHNMQDFYLAKILINKIK